MDFAWIFLPTARFSWPDFWNGGRHPLHWAPFIRSPASAGLTLFVPSAIELQPSVTSGRCTGIF